MTGLFGGGSSSGGGPDMNAYYQKQKAQEKAAMKKKTEEQLSRTRNYGAAAQSTFQEDNLLAGDTSLSSGSLLSLGGNLG